MIISFVLIGVLSAQGNWAFGVKGGLNIAKLTGDDANLEGLANPGFVCGPTVGGFAIYNLNDILAIQTEILFTSKGSSYELDYTDTEYYSQLTMYGTVDMKMNWLDIPILVVYNVMDNVKVFAGPFVEFYLNGKVESDLTITGLFEDETYFESGSESENIKSADVNSPGFGLLFGSTYMVTNNIGIEVRYALGLTSIDEDLSMKNNGIQILVNYYLKK